MLITRLKQVLVPILLERVLLLVEVAQKDLMLLLKELKDLVLKLLLNIMDHPPEINGPLIKIVMEKDKMFLKITLIMKLKTPKPMPTLKEMGKLQLDPIDIILELMLKVMNMQAHTVTSIMTLTPLETTGLKLK